MAYGVTIATDTGGSRRLASFSRPDREYLDDEIKQLSQCVQSLHDMTAFQGGISENCRTELHLLAVVMTHTATT
jgi:hypothetical protein